MSKFSKTLNRVLRGTSDANIGFDDLCFLLCQLGSERRIRGSHHIITMDGVPEILNLQSRGGQCKPYQVKQVRGVILTHGLAGTADDEEAIGEPGQQESQDVAWRNEPDGE